MKVTSFELAVWKALVLTMKKFREMQQEIALLPEWLWVGIAQSV